MLFGLMLVPAMLFVGFALDIARYENTDRHLQAALDIAALAGARELDSGTATAADITVAAKQNFSKNINTMPNDTTCSEPRVSVVMEAQEIEVSGSCQFPTFVGGGFLGPADMTVAGESIAQATYTTLEMALVLDLSGSMAGSKLANLQTAAKRLIDALMTSGTGTRVRIALVPYTHAVNAGIYGNRAAGLADTADLGLDGDEQVCPAERIGDEALTDARPEDGTWLQPPSLLTNFCGTGSMSVGAVIGHSLVPLTSDPSVLHDEIDSFHADSDTGGHLATAWGWYALSPNWGDVWPDDSKPLAYGTTAHTKVAVLMTDGKFNAMIHPAFGLGSSSEHAVNLCDAMKDAGIVIYAIAFDAPLAGERVMHECASSDSHYFAADDGDDLIDAFQEIASAFLGGRIIG